jgi:hypothetical protein
MRDDAALGEFGTERTVGSAFIPLGWESGRQRIEQKSSGYFTSNIQCKG